MRLRSIRLIVTLTLGILVAPLAAGAQPAGKVYRIGFLWDSPAAFPDAIEAFRQGLRDLGYVEGRNIVIEFRWAEGKPERMRELAEELVRLKVDVIMAPSSIYTAAVKRATATIPIIFMSHADPLRTGHVASLARPGANITGLSIMMTETNVKGLELFKEAVPGLSRVAVIWDPATPSHGPGLKAVEVAGPRLGLRIQPVAVRSATEYDGAFAAMVRERAHGVLVLSTPLFIAGAKRLAELALTHKLPSLFGPKHHVEAGGLMSYSPDRPDLYRRGAIYVDKILKGAKPANLPVEQPTKFELVINLKTAKALGLTIPPSVLFRADRVIE
ncbi:MAG: ABC transporter substrate-binding protein [Candidatus Rokubacteria bacterium]|nr:ABC transporter substrate-binding protein [Candidatus Rokubacteria bacterium]